MMQPLFVRQSPKKGRVCLMLGASLLVHGGIVGIAALWLQPEPEQNTVVMDLWPDEGGNLPPTLPPAAPPDLPEPTSTPDVVDKPEPTPPETTETPDIFEATTPPPPPHRAAVSRPVTAVRATSAASNAHSVTGQSAGGGPSAAGVGPANAVGAWVMPHPPYPHVSSAFRPTGSTTVRIITDASGRVSGVTIVKSAGNALLDNQTQSYVRMNWHGPPNASRTTEFVYQIQ